MLALSVRAKQKVNREKYSKMKKIKGGVEIKDWKKINFYINLCPYLNKKKTS